MIIGILFRWMLLPILIVINTVTQASEGAGLLLDLESRRVIMAENASESLPAHSTVALMTLYTALELQRELGVDSSRKIELPRVTTATPTTLKHDLQSSSIDELECMLLVSGDQLAAHALVNFFSEIGVNFTSEMNRISKRLGLTGSHFVTPFETNDPEQVTTPTDLAILAEALFRDHPQTRTWSKTRPTDSATTLLDRSNAIAGVYRHVNKHDGADAVALFENPRSNGAVRRLLAVKLRASDGAILDEEILSMLGNGYRNYETIQVYTPRDCITELPVYKGNKRAVKVHPQGNVWITVDRSTLIKHSSEKLVVKVHYKAPLVAPLQRGEVIGEVTLSFDSEVVARFPIVGADDIAKGNAWRRFVDTLKLAVIIETH